MKIIKTFVGTDDKEIILSNKRLGRIIYHDGRVMIYCGSAKSGGFSDSSYLWTTTDRYNTVINTIKEIHSQMDGSESKYKAEFGDSTITIEGDVIFYCSPHNIHAITIPMGILKEAIDFLLSSGPKV